MVTMAEIADRHVHFEPLQKRVCPRCGAVHHRIDYLCEDCRTKDTKNKRAAGMKGQRVLKRMRAARAASVSAVKVMERERKSVDHWPDSLVMLRALLSKVGIREAGPG